MNIFVYRLSVGDLSFDYILTLSISNFYFVDLCLLQCHHFASNIYFFRSCSVGFGVELNINCLIPSLMIFNLARTDSIIAVSVTTVKIR